MALPPDGAECKKRSPQEMCHAPRREPPPRGPTSRSGTASYGGVMTWPMFPPEDSQVRLLVVAGWVVAIPCFLNGVFNIALAGHRLLGVCLVALSVLLSIQASLCQREL